MTYKQMLLQNELIEDIYTPAIGIELTKEITKTNNRPYVLSDSIEGPKTGVVFSEHFLSVFREITSVECLERMSPAEKKLFWDYSKFQSAVLSLSFDTTDTLELGTDDFWKQAFINYRKIRKYQTPERVVKALSDWAASEVIGTSFSSL